MDQFKEEVEMLIAEINAINAFTMEALERIEVSNHE